MQIIFSRESAEELKKKYTVLELETFEVDGKLLETFCVVGTDQLNMSELPHLDTNIKLHEEFIVNLKDNNTAKCVELANQLKGFFGGELDSFYDIILERINKE